MYSSIRDDDSAGLKNNGLPEYEFPDILCNMLPVLESLLFNCSICNTCICVFDLFML